jgi:hypothetical protein
VGNFPQKGGFMIGCRSLILILAILMFGCHGRGDKQYNRQAMWERQAKEDSELRAAYKEGRLKKVGYYVIEGDTIWEYRIIDARE